MHNFGKNEWNSTISTRWTKVGKYGQTWTIWKIGQYGHFEKIGQNLRNIQNWTILTKRNWQILDTVGKTLDNTGLVDILDNPEKGWKIGKNRTKLNKNYKTKL